MPDILDDIKAFGAKIKGTGANPDVQSQWDAIRKASDALQIKDPVDLATAIHYETGGTFSPGQPGGAGGAYRGLIQFSPDNVRTYGVRPDQGFEDQLMNSVVPYLRDRGVKPGAGLNEIYAAIDGGRANRPLTTLEPATGRTIGDNINLANKQSRPAVLKRFGLGAGTDSDQPTRTVTAPDFSKVKEILGIQDETPAAPPDFSKVKSILGVADNTNGTSSPNLEQAPASPTQPPQVTPVQPVAQPATQTPPVQNPQATQPVAKKLALSDDPVVRDGEEVQPSRSSGQPAVGTVDVDPNWSPEDKVRFAANKLLVGRQTPTGPITPQDIDEWITANKATGDPSALMIGDPKASQFTVFQNMLDQIYEHKKKSPEQLAAELRDRNTTPPSDDFLRQQAIQELSAQKHAENALVTQGVLSPEDIQPVTEDDIQAKIAEYKQALPDEQSLKDKYDYAQTETPLEAGFAKGFAYPGRVLAGLVRPFSEKAYNEVAKQSALLESESPFRNQGQGPITPGENIADFLGATAPQLATVMATPGSSLPGVIAKFAFLGGAEKAGQGGKGDEVGQAILSGGGTGAVFGTSGLLKSPITKMLTVAGGSALVNAASGMPLDQNLQSSIFNTLYEAQGIYGEKMLGKVYRFWKGGEPIGVRVTEDGEVQPAKINAATKVDGGDIVVDPDNTKYQDTEPTPIKLKTAPKGVDLVVYAKQQDAVDAAFTKADSQDRELTVRQSTFKAEPGKLVTNVDGNRTIMDALTTAFKKPQDAEALYVKPYQLPKVVQALEDAREEYLTRGKTVEATRINDALEALHKAVDTEHGDLVISTDLKDIAPDWERYTAQEENNHKASFRSGVFTQLAAGEDRLQIPALQALKPNLDQSYHQSPDSVQEDEVLAKIFRDDADQHLGIDKTTRHQTQLSVFKTFQEAGLDKAFLDNIKDNSRQGEVLNRYARFQERRNQPVQTGVDENVPAGANQNDPALSGIPAVRGEGVGDRTGVNGQIAAEQPGLQGSRLSQPGVSERSSDIEAGDFVRPTADVYPDGTKAPTYIVKEVRPDGNVVVHDAFSLDEGSSVMLPRDKVELYHKTNPAEAPGVKDSVDLREAGSEVPDINKIADYRKPGEDELSQSAIGRTLNYLGVTNHRVYDRAGKGYEVPAERFDEYKRETRRGDQRSFTDFAEKLKASGVEPSGDTYKEMYDNLPGRYQRRLESPAEDELSQAVRQAAAKRNIYDAKDHKDITNSVVEDYPAMAAWFGRGKPNDAPSPVVDPDPVVEEKFQGSRGLSQDSLIKAGLNHVVDAYHSFRRMYREIDPNESPEMATVNDIFRRVTVIPHLAKAKAQDTIAAITKDLGPNNFQTFSRIVQLRDIQAEAEKGLKPDFGLADLTQVNDSLKHFENEALKYPEIGTALKKREDMLEKITRGLVDIGQLPKEVLDDPRYYHRQVLSAIDNIYGSTGSQDVRLHKKGFQKTREGEKGEYNTNYLESESEWLSQAYAQLAKYDAQQEIEAAVNKAPDLKLEAKVRGLKGDDWKTLIPKDHTLWQPKEGNYFMKVGTVLDNLLPSQLLKQLPDSVKNLLAQGQRKVEWVVPKNVAKLLDKFQPDPTEGALSKIAAELQGTWKQWTLVNPQRFATYNLRNAASDLDVVIARYPGALKHVWNAYNALRDYTKNPGSPNAQLVLEAIKNGVIDSGQTFAEIPDVNKLAVFKALAPGERNPLKVPFSKLNSVWDALKGSTNFRENLLRLATYEHLKGRMNNGEQNLYGASVKSQVDAIPDINLRAAKVSRELLGDYGGISEAGRYIRKHILPFYSWLEINAPRYVRMVKNLPYEGDRLNLGSTIAGKSIKALANTPAYTVRAAALTGAFILWNKFGPYKDLEDQLERTDVGRQPHLIVGQREDGSPMVINFETAVTDAMDWLDMMDFPADIKDVQTGKSTIADKLADAAKAPINHIVDAITPAYKLPYELATGRSLYPGLFKKGATLEIQPKSIRDPWEYAARALSVDSLYKRIVGRPAPKEDNVLTNILDHTITSRIDADEATYWTSRADASDWAEKMGKASDAGDPTEKSNALFFYRQALKWGDEAAAQRYLEQYKSIVRSEPKNAGKSEKDLNDVINNGLEKSMEKAHPLGSLNSDQWGPYIRTLNQDQKNQLYLALKFYRDTYDRKDTVGDDKGVSTEELYRMVFPKPVKTVADDSTSIPMAVDIYENAGLSGADAKRVKQAILLRAVSAIKGKSISQEDQAAIKRIGINLVTDADINMLNKAGEMKRNAQQIKKAAKFGY